MRVLFATAEYSPVARVGGLAPAAAGLVKALRRLGVDVEVVLPDYQGIELVDERREPLDVPHWASPASVRSGHLPGVGQVSVIDAPGLRRGHPYVQPDGVGFPDNDDRFFRFSACIAALAERRAPDVLHLNDWHTSATLAFLAAPPPSVLTIHTLGYQGWTNTGWLEAFPYHREAYRVAHDTNPLAGGIRRADAVITVSPTYAREVLTPAGGFGLHEELAAKGDRFLGILNGIDTEEWDPAADPHVPVPYGLAAPAGKDAARTALRAELGLPDGKDPLAVMVTRLVDQKGVDLVLPTLPYLRRIPMQFAVLGSGQRPLVDALRHAAAAEPDRVAFHDGYDEGLAHRLFAGADLFLMPSRFEPCGLAQMQAMRYGALPVVTDVGGLHDTVIDIDTDPARGTGVVAGDVSALGVLDALHRAARAHQNVPRRTAMRRRAMSIDWSWDAPARQHIELYAALTQI